MPDRGRRTIILAVAVVSAIGISFLRLERKARSAQAPAKSIARPEVVVQTGHASRINSAVFGPGNQWLASAGADQVIKIWDVATGRELRTLVGHAGWVNAVAADPKGKFLASGSVDRTVKIWDVATGREVYTLKGHTKPITAVAFNASGQLLASGSADNTLRIWDLASGRELTTLTGHAGPISSLAFSNNDEYLVSGSADTTLKIWATTNWRELRTLKKHTAKISALTISKDSTWIASGDETGVVCLWKAGSDRERFVLKRAASVVLAIAFDSSGALVDFHADGSTIVWDTATGKYRQSTGGTTGEELLFASFNADATRIACSTGSRTVDLRDQTGATLRTLASHSTGLKAVDLSKDGRWIASGADDGGVRLWQIATGREMPRLFTHTSYATSIAFSEDSRLLAAASRSGEVKIWDLYTQRESLSLPGNYDGVDGVAFSPDAKFVAAVGMKQGVEVWNLNTRQPQTLAGHVGETTSIAFSRKEPVLASGGRDKSVRVWNLNTGAALQTFANLNSEINCVAFDGNGGHVAAGDADGTVTVWDLATAMPVQTIAAHRGEVFGVKFSPDGLLLASGGTDGLVKLWDAKTGREIHSLTGPSESINSIAFTIDGQWIVGGSDDGSLSIWNVSRGKLAATLVSARNSDDWLVVSPEGLFDGSPQGWDLILWRFAKDTFKVSPVEAFFGEYYYPGLLADILASKNPQPTQDMAMKDRRQPRIVLASEEANGSEVSSRRIKVRLEINDAAPDEEHRAGCGARDLRLFRNGLLVKEWPGEILGGAARQTIETTVPVVAGENTLTAYAFNADNVKSNDARLSLTGAANLKRVGTAYLLAIGVGHYENSQYDLNYTVADATEVGEQLKAQQERLKNYSPTVIISLTNQEATKANILLAIRRLSGADTTALPQNAPPAIAKIQAAQPEDAVVIYFSGHGTADKDRFFLIPHDLGYRGPRKELDSQGLQTIFTHSITDLELEEALRPLDASQLLLVIDACNSGQALNAAEKRRGPMNTKGLAQLAYEKGMYILTAAQSDEVAFESQALKHSYLAYALVEEGIKSGAADENHDGNILLREWFAYATERVPQIRRERRRGKELQEVEADEEKVQRPRAFYTREVGANQLVIATLTGARGQ